MPDLTLHFVRHGQTAWNAERRFQTPEVPLSDDGRAQALALAEALRGCAAGAILSSDYARAWETATLIGKVLGLPVQPEPALRERNFGELRGRLYEEFTEDEIRRYFREPRERIDGGESWADVHDRVAAFLDRLRAEPPALELILVTHGGTMNIALRHLAGHPIDAFELARLENCALRTVDLRDGAAAVREATT